MAQMIDLQEDDIQMNSLSEPARLACLRYTNCHSLYICTRSFGPRYGGKLLLTVEI